MLLELNITFLIGPLVHLARHKKIIFRMAALANPSIFGLFGHFDTNSKDLAMLVGCNLAIAIKLWFII